MRWVLGVLAATAAVAGCGGDVVTAAEGPRPAAATTTTAPAPDPAVAPRATAEGPATAAPPASSVLAVRRRGGVTPGLLARVRRTPGVEAVARTWRSTALLRRSERAGGRVVSAPRPGWAIPLDVLVVEPGRMAAATGEGAFRGLARGEALLSATSARVRRLRGGDRLRLTGGRALRVAGVVPDQLVRAAELVVTRADAGDTGPVAQVLVRTTDPAALRRAVPSGRRTRTGQLGGPGSRTIARPAELKAAFGEFAVRLPYGEDWITIDPAWRRRQVTTRSVPILGAVTCHRAMFAPLRRALGSLQRRGLARLVDRRDFAGCQAPRRIPGSGALSLHAWGLAVDLNASRNPQGARPRQDPRLVRAFERAGFAWGGRWPTVPDGMHFELHPPGI